MKAQRASKPAGANMGNAGKSRRRSLLTMRAYALAIILAGLATGLPHASSAASDQPGASNVARPWIAAAPPPVPTIDAAPGLVSNSTSPTFSFSDADPGVTFDCRLDKGAFPPCTSPKAYASVAEGPHTFYVKAVDALGNESEAASYSWTIDITPPPTPTISSGPANPSGSSNAHFVFSDAESGVGFACQLDGAAYAPCSNPQDYTVADGGHTLVVEANDAAGNSSGPSAPYSWTVDTVNPIVVLGDKPPPLTNQRTANFSFSSRAGSTFECARDGGVFASCVSPLVYAGLGDGSHVFSVRARSPVGNTGPTTSYEWIIDTVPPQTTIVSTPPATSTDASASFNFSSSEAGSTFACSLDAAGFSPCASPQAYVGLGDGGHTFRVAAVDAAGNSDASAASYSWQIVGVGPATTDHTPPGNVTRLRRRVGYGLLRLAWTPPADSDFDHVEVLVATSPKSRPSTVVYKGRGGRYTNVHFKNGLYYRYAVVSYDHARNASRGATLVVRPSVLMRAPPDGRVVRRPPLLRWTAISKATYYNVQLYYGTQKVLSAWPNVEKLAVRRRWVYTGRRLVLKNGLYTWYVWPGFGLRSKGVYGQLLGQSTFTVR
jgi:hypothetical protein